MKARLSLYLARVRAGQEVVVTDRGRPVAKLVPLGRDEDRGSRRERQLLEGFLIAGRGRVRRALLQPPEGDPARGRSVPEALHGCASGRADPLRAR